MANRIQHGFTILEMVVVIGILSVVIILSADYIDSVFLLFKTNNDQGEAVEQMRTAVEKIAKEVRLAQTGDNGAYPIEQAQSSSLTIYTNIDGDDTREKVRYFLDGETLKKGVIEPTGVPPQYPSANETISTIAISIRNTAIFQYYDQNYDGTTAPLSFPVNTSDVRLIHLSFAVDIDLNKPPSAYTIETSISLRNLKDNL